MTGKQVSSDQSPCKKEQSGSRDTILRKQGRIHERERKL